METKNRRKLVELTEERRLQWMAEVRREEEEREEEEQRQRIKHDQALYSQKSSIK